MAETTFEGNSAQMGGGALYFQCEPTDTERCEIFLVEDSFVSNYAGLTGGAMQYEYANFTQVLDTHFSKNVATQGDDLGSYIKSLSFVDFQTGEVISLESLEDNGYTISLTPGHLFIIEATIYDQEGRQYSAENEAIARLNFRDPDAVDSQFEIMNGDVLAKNGTFLFDQLYLKINPGAEVSISLILEGIDNLKQDI